MTALDTTTLDKVFKVQYPDLEILLYEECPLFAWLPKNRRRGAKRWDRTIRISGVNGATNFGVALNKKRAPNYVTFQRSRSTDYTHISVDAQALHATKENAWALREAVNEGVDSAKYEDGRSSANQLWGVGDGVRGVIATGGISGSTITLATTQDITRFEKGMEIVTGTTTYASSYTEVAVIDKVDRDAGTITLTATVASALPNAAAADNIWRHGDDDIIDGVFAWIPKADVATSNALFTSFSDNTVDRRQDVTRLAGSRLDGVGANMEDVVFEAVARNRINGGRADTLWLNSLDMARLQKEMASKTWIEVKTDKAQFGLRGLGFHTSHGPIVVMDDADCPYGHALLTRRDSWMIEGLRELPHVSDEDGRRWRMETGADAVTSVLRKWWQLDCKKPVDSTSIKW